MAEIIPAPQKQLLALHLDVRMHPLWRRIWEDGTIDPAQVAPLIRDAYMRGYYAALIEPERGSLYVRFLAPVPEREVGDGSLDEEAGS